ncbi:carbohydrate ABC transporter permease [Curtobacterium sp. ISL-83]|uniref:carbohydrate ABC transporter permease n=1 Tax=Curtobacterium sp. ISL-83 TaxID=2819145 RepID=UPI001BE9CD7D|nr:sugar ABC transporter permease [Curtobacterium sp. ISL-83]MBT2502111.1 sugar ABC transporter permease [Curtobacterium sp. ISL-83]
MTTQQLGRRRRYRPPGQLGGRTPLNGSFRRRATIVGFLAPAIVVLGAFVLWPMISALQLSFTDGSGFGDPRFIGIANYVKVFTDPDVLRSIGNTALYAVLFTPVAIAVALALALVLNHPALPFRGFFRSALFLPFIVSLAVAAFAWSYLLDPQIGLLNHWLQVVGIRLGNVLQDPTLAMPTVVLVAVWKSFGFYMVIFLAGLQEIPTSLYEAAQLDGASSRQRFTNVTFPMLSNTMAFVVIVALIAALQAFDQIYVLTGGGPYRSTETIVMQVYQSGFKDLDLGFASALAYVLLIATLLLSLVQFLFFAKRGEDAAS